MDEVRGSINFTLTPQSLTFSVDVQLRRVGDRWIARVLALGEERTGLASSARAALAAALESLGSAVATVLAADLGLLEPSLRVVEVDAASVG